MTITPNERLQNFIDATHIKCNESGQAGGVYEDYEFLPDHSKLVVRWLPLFGTVTFRHVEDCGTHSILRDIDRATAAGFMGWKMITPDEI